MNQHEKIAKRLIDLWVAGLLLVRMSPVLLVPVAILFLVQGATVFFRQLGSLIFFQLPVGLAQMYLCSFP